MPVVTCPHCRHEQIVPRDLDGLTVNCEKCEGEFVAEEGGRRSKYRRDRAGDTETDRKAIIQTALVVGGLLAVAGLLLFLIFSARSPKGAEKMDALPPDEVAQAERVAREQRAKEVSKTAESVGTGAVAVGVFLVIVVYVLVLLFAGAWVARDAYARGMNGLGWASFYYLFHALGRFLIVGLFFTVTPFFKEVGAFIGLMVAEVASWAGLVVYLVARRPGSLLQCEVCRNKQLGYLTSCPHCSHSVHSAA